MTNKLEKYGVKPVHRIPMPATKKLDLGGEEGKQIIESETKLALLRHSKTLKKLADM